MAGIFRQNTVSCFFCLSTVVPRPRNPRSFRCPYCENWNRYDDHDEIISYEPAMHDESLNRKSFAKRASPSRDRLPTMNNESPFCHNCQTNQTLILNLLSNYLPSPDHPDYSGRVESLPEYKESLLSRYPLVCASCLPSVEEDINKKNAMARTTALGEWLKESKGKGKQRQASTPKPTSRRIRREINLWKARGCLWAATLALVLFGNSSGALGVRPSQPLGLYPSFLPVLAFISILWTAWDPTYSSLRRARLQGRDVRQKGKKQYIALQMTAWFSRLLTSIFISISYLRPNLDYLFLSCHPSSRQSRIYFSISLLLELVILIASLTVLRLHQPSSIRLIDTHSHRLSTARQTPDITFPARHPTPSSLPEPDHLAAHLAAIPLTSKPVMSPTHPIFGVPSLVAPPNDVRMHDPEPDADAMDWTPTNPPPEWNKNRMANEDGPLLRRQTFFAPEQPTGLEDLFQRTRLADDTSGSAPRHGRNYVRWWRRWWLYSILAALIAIVVYKIRQGPVLPSLFARLPW